MPIFVKISLGVLALKGVKCFAFSIDLRGRLYNTRTNVRVCDKQQAAEVCSNEQSHLVELIQECALLDLVSWLLCDLVYFCEFL